MQRFLFHTLFPADSETRASPSMPQAPLSPAEQNKPCSPLWPAQLQLRVVQTSSGTITYQAQQHKWALLHLSPQSLFIIWMWGELVCAKPDRKEQELPFALLHDSLTSLLLVQRFEFSNAAVVPPQSYSWVPSDGILPSDLLLTVPSLFAHYVSVHIAKEVRHTWECLSEHLSAMWATETPEMWRK